MGQRSYTAQYRADAVKLAHEKGSSAAARECGYAIHMGKPRKDGQLATDGSTNRAAKRIKNGGADKTTGTGKQSIKKRVGSEEKRDGNTRGGNGFFRKWPEETGKRLRLEYIRNHAENGETALNCRVLSVTPQG